jgi:hypothetical protein
MSDVDDPILDRAPVAGRSLDIELGTDLVSVDLDILDPDPNDIMDLLKEADSGVLVWTRVADEYWRKGMKEGAEMIVQTAKSCAFILFMPHIGSTTLLSSVRTVGRFTMATTRV